MTNPITTLSRERLQEIVYALSAEPCDADPILEGVTVGEIGKMVRALLEVMPVYDAAQKLVKCKGRYHAELNYKALAELFGVKTHDVSNPPAPNAPDGWTASGDANAALVMLDRIDTIDSDDDCRIEEVKNIIRRMAAAPAPGGDDV
ncbi:hypothetical protein AAH450_06650 [Erwinia sp. P7711]|uniref:hypothetical protein n=1 Tax=Erwinia sp. P7711 TaxID=3141451 RepID=UPI003192303B